MVAHLGALELVALVDELGMDSISLGVTLGHIMEWNRRQPDDPLAGGISFGDYEAITEAIVAVAEGGLPEVGEGTLRVAMRTDSLAFAMQSKGIEYPAYVPHSNPGRIIPTIFKAPEALHNHRHSVFIANIAHNAAHGISILCRFTLLNKERAPTVRSGRN